MSDVDFHELRGEYVDHAGQQIDPREYLDFFEPLGSALSRYPDGAGGPFVYRFTASGGRVVGALGWAVSAASRRFGAWTLWGMWTNNPIPSVALPMFWPWLSDPLQAAGMVARANDDAQRLFDPEQRAALCEEIDATRLHDARFRDSLAAELARAYAVPPPHLQPIEIELTPDRLDLLPWIYLLGPVSVTAAQLMPSRFNGAGYQYILGDRGAPVRETDVPGHIKDIVDTTARNVADGWQKAYELRAERAPRRVPKRAPPPPLEPLTLQEDQVPARKAPAAKITLPIERWIPLVTPIYRIAVLALLVWIALELRDIRNAMPARRAAVNPAMTTTAASVVPTTTAEPSPAPAEPESPAARVARLADTLAAAPPQGIRVNRTAIVDSRSLANAAVEVILRRNGCFSRAEAVDGKLSAAEQRAMRNCAALRNERVVNSRGEIDEARAIAWLERALS